jgi:hypothetical protein
MLTAKVIDLHSMGDAPAVPDDVPPNDGAVLGDLLDNATNPAADALEGARRIVANAIVLAKDDPTAHLYVEVMNAFRAIKEADPLEYEAVRTRMKQANNLVRMEALDDFTRGDDDSGGGPESAATALAALAGGLCELWHDADGNAFASFEREHQGSAHREHWSIESSGYREWLAWLAHTQLGVAPSSETVKSASNTLAGKAKFDGEEHVPAIRVAKSDMGYWLDLCDDQWRSVLLTATGWQVMSKPPVRFTRNRAMRSLVMPARGGSFEPLWELVNVPVEDRPLVLAWILESLRPDTPYPVLELIGEQGSAKSTTQETIRHFLDPNKVMLRGRPKGVEDVFVAAGSNHILSLENLSGISAELSDALCTISTGGGQAGRQLFTNGEEHIIEAHNPVMLNGIGAVVTRPDLLDRTVAVCLPTIQNRMTEAEHAARLNECAPAIMGGLLDLFAKTLATLDEVRIDPAQRPRMADFAQLGEAMHRAIGGVPGDWLAKYVEHRCTAIRRTVYASPVAQACIEFAEGGGRYAGTVKGLLELLNTRNAASNAERGEYWPRSPKGLGDALRRAAPALRQIGIHLTVEAKARRDGVHCQLRREETLTFPASVNIEGPYSPSSQCSRRWESVTL